VRSTRSVTRAETSASKNTGTSARARWDSRWAAAQGPLGEPHPLVKRLADQLSPASRVLDIAAGRGRQSLCLLRSGHQVTATDVSEVGLQRLAEMAVHEKLSVDTVVADLGDGLPESLVGPWDAVVCVDYFQPDLWPVLHQRLAPHGAWVLSLATTDNLNRHARPSRRFLADPQAGRAAVGPLTSVEAGSAWRQSGRHELWVWATRPVVSLRP